MAGKALVKRVLAPEQLSGSITVPGDKSISHRAVILNSLASGDGEIRNLAPGRDCSSTANCLRKLGIASEKQVTDSSRLLVHGVGLHGLSEPKNVLNAGNSATTMRLLSGVLAAQPFLSVFTGDMSLRSRPMKRLIEPLRLMGADIFGRNRDSFAPLVIRGKQLHGINYSLPVPSAQIKSAILLAGLFADRSTVIEELQPSRDHTERLLQQMGAVLICEGNHISLTPLPTHLNAVNLCVPGDISSAAYWLVAGVIHPNARITIQGCGINETRIGIIDMLLNMGAKLILTNKRFEGNEPVADLFVESSQLRGIEINGEQIPRIIDEIPVLAVAGCMAEGRTVIRGASELRIKESDRIRSTVEELSRMGAMVEELPDGMVIYGGRVLKGAVVRSHLDHRLAMSLAIAGLVAKGETIIKDANVVKISYPDFWDDLAKISN